ncbi:hypothetical protein LQW54_003728 [Pestalotiopsis sp. IQ-011]
MALESSAIFPHAHDLVSKLKSEVPEIIRKSELPEIIKSHEASDLDDDHSDTHKTAWSSYQTPGVSHQIISSYFIGPQAENLQYFENNIHTILEELRLARNKYYPEDGRAEESCFQKSMKKLSNAAQKVANLLGRTSIPFWSPRYEAHMCTDMSMASLLGYFMTMIYNPNNVALEASPLSTIAEIEVGEQLCELFGYNIDEDNQDAPQGWGHVTHAASSITPLSIREAMLDDGPFSFLDSEFTIETCAGEIKLFSELSDWELLNLKSGDILDIPDRLYQEYGISNKFLSDVMNKYTIQSTGEDGLENKYTEDKPAQYMLSTTRHYSWPKGAVDKAVRVDVAELDKKLKESLEKERPVYAVVAIIETTEEGAVDPLDSISALRKQYQAKGMSFLVHADAAWGGYFCSMLPKDYRPGDITKLPTEMGEGDGFVPDASLRAETQEDLYAMRFADSITVDPHKAGYIPYPAGEGSKPGAAAVSTWLSNKTIGLNQQGYGALLSEVTWTRTRLSAEWAAMTNSTSPFVCVPFNELPSERAANSSPEKVEAEKTRIREEILKKSNADIVKEDRSRPRDQNAMKLMRDLGSDLNINAFAINFRYSDGRLNEDVEEANYLMKRVIEALSVDSPDDDPSKIPPYLTSTEFSDELYGDCKKHFMKRLGLEDSTQDLMVLRNVVMSPFPTDGNFINRLADIFYKTVKDETEIVRKRNEVGEDLHNFLIQGTENIYLIHLPMFHVANDRQQLIVSVDFDQKSRQKHVGMKKANPSEPMLLVTKNKTLLPEIVKNNGNFAAQITTKHCGVILKNVNVKVTSTVVSRPLNSKWRLPNYPSNFMPFYLYGTANEANIDHVIARAPNSQLSAGRCTLDLEGEHGDNIWSKALVLTLEDVYEEAMQPLLPNSEIGSKNGAIVASEPSRAAKSSSSFLNGSAHHGAGNTSSRNSAPASDVTSETRSGKMRGSGFFFRPGARFNVKVYEDGDRGAEDAGFASFRLGRELGRGTLELGDGVYVDSEAMNFDPFQKVDKVADWRHEFGRIGKELE